MKIMVAFGFASARIEAAVAILLLGFSQQPVPSQSVTTNRPLTAAEIAGIRSPFWRLYLAGNLDAAYELAQREEAEYPDLVWSREWMMGRIQERMGANHCALEHFQRSLDNLRARGRWSATNPRGVKNFTRDELSLLDNIYAMYLWQGKIGLATRTRFEILKKMEAATGETVMEAEFHKGESILVFEGLKAEYLAQRSKHHGVCSEACEIYRRIAQKAEDEDRPQLVRDVLAKWTSHLAFFEHYSEALALRRKIEPLPFDRRYVYRADLLTIELAENLAQRDGVTGEVWTLLDPALGRLESSPHHHNWLEGGIIKARLLSQAGRSAEALALLNRVIKSTREENYQPQLAGGLEARARIQLNQQETVGVEADVRESLQIYRTLGKKEREPNLYELRARLFGRQGQYDDAVKTWEQGYALSENLELHFRALQMLLGLAELQLQQNRLYALNATWTRIRNFVADHRADLPDPTMLRFHLALLDYLKSRGSQSELVTANDDARTFVKYSTLSAYQLREFRRWQESFPGILVSLKPAPSFAPPPPQRKPELDLQPVLVKTRVRTNEFARAYFVLSNPSGETAKTTLRITGETFRGDWQTNQDDLLLKLTPSDTAAVAQTEIEVPPGREVLLSLECAPDSKLSNNIVMLQCQSEIQRTARWDFGFGDDARTLAVVNASLAEDNPFYSLSFFNDVYFRGELEALINLRVQASEPCRIEVVDAFSHELLAIDANGDGDFEDLGDAFHTDIDVNGYPDFKVNSQADVKRLELAVFPHFKNNRNQREIEITLSFQTVTGWIPQATDRLIIR